jgi:hypothetical protein
MKPTNHLRYVECKIRDIGTDIGTDSHVVSVKIVNVLQQFWIHPLGKDIVGDMFQMDYGSWINVPVVRDEK